MNSLQPLDSGQGSMSSLHISDITGKRHFSIMRDIRDLLKQGVSQCNFVLAEYRDGQGKLRPCYTLTKKGCFILASGYDALLRERIIDRMEELELTLRAGLAFPAPALPPWPARVVRYSPRSIAVVGDTRALHPLLKGMGGMWCPCLTVDGLPARGWVFRAHREGEVRQAVQDSAPSAPTLQWEAVTRAVAHAGMSAHPAEG